jgi:hypothetical protein
MLDQRHPLHAGPPPEALVDVLDKLLDTGVVLDGQIVLSLAGVDLVHIGLRALLASVDTAARLVVHTPPAPGAVAPATPGAFAPSSPGACAPSSPGAFAP